jgi:hypothetical protein
MSHRNHVHLTTHFPGATFLPIRAIFIAMTLLSNSNASTPPPPQKSPFKSPYLYTFIIFVAAAAYVLFVLVTRHEANRAFERRNAEKAAERRHADDQAAIEQLGGSELAIRAFYATPAAVHRGQSAQLCYDVANAKTVILDPPAGNVWPSHNRCLDISPKRTTTYTLTIADASGKSTSQSVEVRVQ